MTYRMYGAFVASLGVAAFMLGASETFARPAGAAPGAAPGHGFAAPRPMFRPPGAQAFRHHPRRGNIGQFWPGAGGFYYGANGYGANGEVPVDVGQPASGNFHYTYSYDVPWDWTHRYPLTLPSERPYVPSCNTEVVTVPGRGGEQSINITRCY
jgi:hypothetical protein